jgi:hypothetical protein
MVSNTRMIMFRMESPKGSWIIKVELARVVIGIVESMRGSAAKALPFDGLMQHERLKGESNEGSLM